MRYNRDTYGWFVRFHCNAVARTIRTEAALPGFGTIWFDNRGIMHMISLSKSKEKFRVMYDSAEGKQFNMVIPGNKVLFNKSHNGLYHHNMEDRDFVIVNKMEDNREGLSSRELCWSS